MSATEQAVESKTARRGFFPLVMGRDVRVERGGGVAFLARERLTVTRGGGQWIVSLRDLDVRQGGGAMLIGRNVRVERGAVGVLLAARATIDPGSRVLLRVTPAIAIAAAGAFAAGWLARRRR